MMDFYTSQQYAESRRQEMLRQAENERLVQQIQANQILSRWVLSLLRRSISQPPRPRPVEPCPPQRRPLVRSGG